MLPTCTAYVFVYGTLRRGESRDINLLLPAPRWLGLASVPGVLHDLGDYPGMILQGESLVTGEVYEISEELERQLDEIEEVWPQKTGEYNKRQVLVQLDSTPSVLLLHIESSSHYLSNGLKKINCILYEISLERTRGMQVIAGGDWVQHRFEKCSATTVQKISSSEK